MGNSNNNDPLAGALRALRDSNHYHNAAISVKKLLSLECKFDIFELKVLLLRAAMDHFTETKERDMVLVALGLLDGYFYDTKYLENFRAHDTKEIGARREKYLQCGPYVRTKAGKRYESFDSIPSEKEKKNIKNSLGKQDGRLIDKLTEYIRQIPDMKKYYDEAVADPDFDYAGIHIKNKRKIYFILLPKQCCFLEDFPPPKDKPPTPLVIQDNANNNPPEAIQHDPAVALNAGTNTEVSQLTVIQAPLSYGWGDSNGRRPSYTLAQIRGGILGETIVFNSISDSVIGNEKNFIGVREDDGIHAGKENRWHCNRIAVENGKTYIIRLYVHNNNPNGIRAIAKNVRVAINLPYLPGKQIRVTGFIESTNATPSEYWSNIVFYNDTTFRLKYIPGSALLENNRLGKNHGIKVSDDIIKKASSGGILVDYDSLDGSIPGCYQYDSFITIRVRAIFDIN